MAAKPSEFSSGIIDTSWAFKESIIQRLSMFERKIFRKIFGPTKEDNGNWRIKTNIELDEVIKHRNKTKLC
jgi:hypothetical protein